MYFSNNKLQSSLATNNIFLWPPLAFVIKILFVMYMLSAAHANDLYDDSFINYLVFEAKDYVYFIKPAQRYFTDSLLTYQGNGIPFAGRMPGYSFPYILLRYLFAHNTALTLLIVAQIALSAISIYWVALSAKLFYKKDIAFYVAFVIYAFANITTAFDFQTMTESFAVSSCCGFMFFMFKYFLQQKENKHLIAAGFFAMWTIFLRPFMGVIIVIVPIILAIFSFREKQRIFVTIKSIFCFLVCFVVAETAWITRNYLALHKFVPLETNITESYGKLYSKAWIEIRTLTTTLGESAAYFEPNTMAAWFKGRTDTSKSVYFQFKTNKLQRLTYNKDSLLWLKKNYLKFHAETNKKVEAQLETTCINTALRYKKEYEQKNKLNIYIKFPLVRLKNYLFASGSGYLLLPAPAQMQWHQLAIKIMQSLLYYFILLFGIFSFISLLLNIKKCNALQWLLLLCTLANIAVIVLWADIQENRYLLLVMPFIFLLGLQPIIKILERIGANRVMVK